MKITLIAACDKNRVIGHSRSNTLPWHLPKDFEHFKETTKDKYVLMGRKNWESIPEKFRPLPNRHNIVITNNPNYEAKGAVVFNKIYEGIEYARSNGESELFIIGGGEIYRQTLHLADSIILSEIHYRFRGDVFFPVFSEQEFKLVHQFYHGVDENNKYSFDISEYQRLK